jgi:hypothetical protein
MCDYSLHGYPNRLAFAGEDLIAYRFGGVSLGLASPADVGGYIASTHCGAAPPKFWSWAGLKECLKAQRPGWEKHIPAVCVPPGARLLLKDIPKRAQRELGVSGTEVVFFVETTAEVNTATPSSSKTVAACCYKFFAKDSGRQCCHLDLRKAIVLPIVPASA